MRKLGIKVLIFGIVFLVLIKIIGFFDNIDRETSTNPNIIRIANAHRFDSLDILFVGSSASYSGIDPAYFDSIGLRTYNLSVAAAGPYFYELLINDYIRSVKQKPKAVFILVMPVTFSEKVDDFYEIGIHRYLEKSLSNEKIAQTYAGWKIYPYLLIKSFQKGTKNLVFNQKATPATLAGELKDKGFYRSDEVTSLEKERKESPAYADWRSLKFNSGKFNYLVKFTEALKAQGIKVVFYSLPGNKSSYFFNIKYIADYSMREFMLKQEWPFLDLSSLPLDSLAYRNADHLNTYGASIVSSQLITGILNNRELTSIFNLPDSVLNKQQNK